ncbi:MAG: DUF2061 domain-containing protein [Rhodobacteraceae bacterium]|nr:DUF2061 domain-containing protein [Paracoccaceae bacterium]
MDSAKRTVLKAIIWQITGIFTMGIVGFFMTGSIAQGLGLALANTAVGTVTYILYERFWARVRWGRS